MKNLIKLLKFVALFIGSILLTLIKLVFVLTLLALNMITYTLCFCIIIPIIFIIVIYNLSVKEDNLIYCIYHDEEHYISYGDLFGALFSNDFMGTGTIFMGDDLVRKYIYWSVDLNKKILSINL